MALGETCWITKEGIIFVEPPSDNVLRCLGFLGVQKVYNILKVTRISSFPKLLGLDFK
jgi:hypothetical protein